MRQPSVGVATPCSRPFRDRESVPFIVCEQRFGPGLGRCAHGPAHLLNTDPIGAEREPAIVYSTVVPRLHHLTEKGDAGRIANIEELVVPHRKVAHVVACNIRLRREANDYRMHRTLVGYNQVKAVFGITEEN